MHRFIIGVLIAAALLCLVAICALWLSGRAHAQFVMCGERAQIVAQLAKKYQETRQASGMVGTQGVAELFVSAKGTWTMLVTLDSGKGCIVAAGNEWEAVPTVLKGPPL